jgi:hypothetical protein
MKKFSLYFLKLGNYRQSKYTGDILNIASSIFKYYTGNIVGCTRKFIRNNNNIIKCCLENGMGQIYELFK